MLKQPVSFVGFILTLGLCCSAQMSSAAEPTLPANIPGNLSTQISQSSYNSVAEPIRLEISLSRRQVTVYQGNTSVKNYPIAIGRSGWETPAGNFQVLEMLKNPTWIHPLTGKSIQGGSPENPLGHYWIGFWTDGKNWVGFHGTPDPSSVGKAASHGCIRMYNKDVEELFQSVHVGTPVTVVK